MVNGEMWGNVAVLSNMLWRIGIVCLISANSTLEAIALSAIQEEPSKEQQFFEGDSRNAILIPQTFPPPNLPTLAQLPSLSNFTSPYDYRKVRAISTETDPPILLAEGFKVQASRTGEMNEGARVQKKEKKKHQHQHQLHQQPLGYGGKGESENAKTRKKSILKNRIGPMLSILPLMMQLWSLPGALASIKMSLLKSIFVAKLALLMLLLNILRNYQKAEVVLVHQAQHHQHYYHDYQRLQDDEDEETSW